MSQIGTGSVVIVLILALLTAYLLFGRKCCDRCVGGLEEGYTNVQATGERICVFCDLEEAVEHYFATGVIFSRLIEYAYLQANLRCIIPSDLRIRILKDHAEIRVAMASLWRFMRNAETWSNLEIGKQYLAKVLDVAIRVFVSPSDWVTVGLEDTAGANITVVIADGNADLLTIAATRVQTCTMLYRVATAVWEGRLALHPAV